MSKINHYKSFVTTIILILVILTTPVLNVKGENLESIYIREDGTIEPTTVPITRQENLYTLTGDLINYFLYIQKAGITIDGANYKLQGNKSGATGILVYRDNTTIKNIQISQYGTSISLSSNNNTITNCTITQNTQGISLGHSSNNSIIANKITDNVNGIHISGFPRELAQFFNFSNNIISYNNITENIFGILLYNALDNIFILNNNFLDNYVGIELKESNTTIYGNNFHRNSEHTRVDYFIDEEEKPSFCIWDNSTAGSYWSDYTGTDSNEDGIGDRSYKINQNNRDYYPLMIQLTNNYVFPIDPSPTPSTSPTLSPTPIRFYNPYLILFGSTLLLIGLGILAYYKKYRRKT